MTSPLRSTFVTSLQSTTTLFLAMTAHAFLAHAAPALPTPSTPPCLIVTIFGRRTLDCTDRALASLPSNPGVGRVSELAVLLFTDNKLESIKTDMFGLKPIYANLQEIRMERNQIETVERQSWRGLNSIQLIDLSGNRLHTIEANTFEGLHSVRFLSLADNPLRTLHSSAFANLSNLEELNFENCRLMEFDVGLLRGLGRLTTLNLEKNHLRGLLVRGQWGGGEVGGCFPGGLSVVRLSGNPWVCDCRLRWFKHWLLDFKVNWDFGRATPACAGPDLLRGVAWRHLTPAQFACASRILINSTVTTAHAGSHACTPRCDVIGSPRPVVTWYRYGQPINDELVETMVGGGSEGVVGGGEGGEEMGRVISCVRLVNVTVADAGDYKCVANNSAGRSEVVFKLHVNSSLAVSSAQQPSPEGLRAIEAALGATLGALCLLLALTLAAICAARCCGRPRRSYKVREQQVKNDIKLGRVTATDQASTSKGGVEERLLDTEPERAGGAGEPLGALLEDENEVDGGMDDDANGYFRADVVDEYSREVVKHEVEEALVSSRLGGLPSTIAQQRNEIAAEEHPELNSTGSMSVSELRPAPFSSDEKACSVTLVTPDLLSNSLHRHPELNLSNISYFEHQQQKMHVVPPLNKNLSNEQLFEYCKQWDSLDELQCQQLQQPCDSQHEPVQPYLKMNTGLHDMSLNPIPSEGPLQLANSERRKDAVLDATASDSASRDRLQKSVAFLEPLRCRNDNNRTGLTARGTNSPWMPVVAASSHIGILQSSSLYATPVKFSRSLSGPSAVEAAAAFDADCGHMRGHSVDSRAARMPNRPQTSSRNETIPLGYMATAIRDRTMQVQDTEVSLHSGFHSRPAVYNRDNTVSNHRKPVVYDGSRFDRGSLPRSRSYSSTPVRMRQHATNNMRAVPHFFKYDSSLLPDSNMLQNPRSQTSVNPFNATSPVPVMMSSIIDARSNDAVFERGNCRCSSPLNNSMPSGSMALPSSVAGFTEGLVLLPPSKPVRTYERWDSAVRGPRTENHEPSRPVPYLGLATKNSNPSRLITYC